MAQEETATFANGCFWCTEAVFKRLRGVHKVTAGYAGGTIPNPTYDQVAMKKSGYAESIQILFDPSLISYEVLVQIFFYTHDPTSLNRQGADIGPEYRSSIFYHSERQRLSAEKVKSELMQREVYKKPIVTEIIPFTTFYPAEWYHQNFYDENRTVPYCTIVIDPKIKKLLEHFASYIDPHYLTH